MDLARVVEKTSKNMSKKRYKGQDLGDVSHTIISLFSNCAFKSRVENLPLRVVSQRIWRLFQNHRKPSVIQSAPLSRKWQRKWSLTVMVLTGWHWVCGSEIVSSVAVTDFSTLTLKLLSLKQKWLCGISPWQHAHSGRQSKWPRNYWQETPSDTVLSIHAWRNISRIWRVPSFNEVLYISCENRW